MQRSQNKSAANVKRRLITFARSCGKVASNDILRVHVKIDTIVV